MPAASEHQRFVDARLEVEGGFLVYEGSVEHARCSDRRDEQNIRGAVTDWSVLDRAVAVLRRAGMSTSSLRRAAAFGVDVRDLGRVNFAALAFAWCLWLWSACFFATLPHGSWLDAGCAALWAAAWLSLRRRDQRAFAASALGFFTAFRFVVVVLACTALAGYRRGHFRMRVMETLAERLWPWTALLSALQLLTLAVPLGSLAAVPLVGAPVANALLLRCCSRRAAVAEAAVELARRS